MLIIKLRSDLGGRTLNDFYGASCHYSGYMEPSAMNSLPRVNIYAQFFIRISLKFRFKLFGYVNLIRVERGRCCALYLLNKVKRLRRGN